MISTTRKNWFFCLAPLGANQVFWRRLDTTEVDSSCIEQITLKTKQKYVKCHQELPKNG
jgi:hypothetical protein